MAMWTPAQISTTLWLDASDSASLYDATSGGSLVAANSGIARWQDKSGNARHVTQAAAGSRPLRKTAIKNSLDIARFDGTNDLLETTFASFGSSYSMVAVAMSTNAASTGGGLIVTRSKSSGIPINPQISHNSGVSQFAVRDDASNVVSNSISGMSNNTWYLMGGVRSGNTVNTYRDGVAGTTGTATFGTATTTVTSVGAIYTGTTTPFTFWNGDIAEIVVCGLADRVITEGYLAHKWGMSASLDASHPYKSSAPTAGGVTPRRRTTQASIRSTF